MKHTGMNILGQHLQSALTVCKYGSFTGFAANTKLHYAYALQVKLTNVSMQ
jgi:hypothetical protein